MGEPIRLPFVDEITSIDDPTIAIGWELSLETIREIEEIEACIIRPLFRHRWER